MIKWARKQSPDLVTYLSGENTNNATQFVNQYIQNDENENMYIFTNKSTEYLLYKTWSQHKIS